MRSRRQRCSSRFSFRRAARGEAELGLSLDSQLPSRRCDARLSPRTAPVVPPGACASTPDDPSSSFYFSVFFSRRRGLSLFFGGPVVISRVRRRRRRRQDVDRTQTYIPELIEDEVRGEVCLSAERRERWGENGVARTGGVGRERRGENGVWRERSGRAAAARDRLASEPTTPLTPRARTEIAPVSSSCRRARASACSSEETLLPRPARARARGRPRSAWRLSRLISPLPTSHHGACRVCARARRCSRGRVFEVASSPPSRAQPSPRRPSLHAPSFRSRAGMRMTMS